MEEGEEGEGGISGPSPLLETLLVTQYQTCSS
jgi:hypothetical protein